MNITMRQTTIVRRTTFTLTGEHIKVAIAEYIGRKVGHSVGKLTDWQLECSDEPFMVVTFEQEKEDE